MKQFRKILGFEWKNYITNKIFVGITLFLVLVISLVMFYPRISEVISESDNTDNSPALPIMFVAGNTEKYTASIKDAFTKAFPNYTVSLFKGNTESLKSEIIEGNAECAFFINDETSFTYFVEDLSVADNNTTIAAETIRHIYQVSSFATQNVSPNISSQILSTSIDFKTVNLGKDQTQNFFYTYVMIFALYLVILLYGQMIATNVATEKSSRAMELLITSAKPTSLMFGKVIASCMAGLVQIVCVFGSALLFYRINRDYWNDNEIISSIFGMPTDLFVYMLIFFVLGFFIYAFMYGAIGSTVSKLEDTTTAVMPITLLFIIGFFVVMFSMVNGTVDTTLMRVCSYIPFTSPVAMFTRIAMSSVPYYEICISIALLLLSVVGIGFVAAKIYRVGVLLYGTSPKINSIVRALRKG